MSAALAGRRGLPGAGAVVAALAAAAVLGALAVGKPTYAFALVLAALLALLIAADAVALPLFLVFVMFVEAVALGPGLQVGRLAGAVAIVVLALFLLLRGARGLRMTPLVAVVGLYGIWLLASALWAASAARVLTTLASFVLSASYMLAIALLVRRRRDVTAVFATLTVGSAIFGLAAFATYSASSTGRSEGLVGDPNFFAVYQLIAFAPALALAAGDRRPRRRAVLYGVVVVIVLSVVSSLSRGGLIALGIAVAATLVLPWRLFFHRRGRKAGYVAALAFATALAAAGGSTRVVQRAQSIFSPDDKGSGRTDLWAAALHGWHDHPLLGLGAGNFFTKSLDLLQTTPGVCTGCAYAQSNRLVHNAYLETLTELGPLGLALFLGIIALAFRTYVVAFRRARRAGDRTLERYAVALVVSLSAYCVTAFFLSNELAKGLWVLIGLAMALDVVTRRLPAAAPVYDPRVSAEEPREAERPLWTPADDQRRLDRRRAALDERERELAEREAAVQLLADRQHELELAAERLERERVELERARADLERRTGEVARIHERYEADAAALVQQRAALEAERDASVQALADRLELERLEVARRAQELDELARRQEAALAVLERDRAAFERERHEHAPPPPPAPVVPPSVVAPPPVAQPPVAPQAGDALEVRPGIWSVPALARAVEARRGSVDAARIEEWESYLEALRPEADETGGLPVAFDALVWDVFADLVAPGRA